MMMSACNNLLGQAVRMSVTRLMEWLCRACLLRNWRSRDLTWAPDHFTASLRLLRRCLHQLASSSQRIHLLLRLLIPHLLASSSRCIWLTCHCSRHILHQSTSLYIYICDPAQYDVPDIGMLHRNIRTVFVQFWHFSLISYPLSHTFTINMRFPVTHSYLITMYCCIAFGETWQIRGTISFIGPLKILTSRIAFGEIFFARPKKTLSVILNA